jgi:folate-dependent phosphoribosylglycinamide formyltransferase PurN
MKIVALFGDDSNQRALAHRIEESVPLAHIARIQLRTKSRRRILRSAVSLTLGRSLRSAWRRMLRHYDETFGEWPSVPSSTYSSANDPGLIELVERERPDLVLISGTDLVRKATLDRFATKVMNLHTGISPHIRGGPNCTNWALALGQFDLIGSTVMWIDPGIDTGAIITTERTPLTGRETLAELHIKVMDHAHDLYRRAVEAFAQGRSLPSVPQNSIAKGRLFLARQWDSFAIVRAAFNHRFRYRPFSIRPEIRLISLNSPRKVSPSDIF